MREKISLQTSLAYIWRRARAKARHKKTIYVVGQVAGGGFALSLFHLSAVVSSRVLARTFPRPNQMRHSA